MNGVSQLWSGLNVSTSPLLKILRFLYLPWQEGILQKCANMSEIMNIKYENNIMREDDASESPP